MINARYQILLLGENSELIPVVQSRLKVVLNDIQISEESYDFVYPNDFKEKSLGINPTIALYFTSETANDKDADIVSVLKQKSIVIIPIVDAFDNAGRLLPECLKEINAACIANKDDENGITEVTNHVLSNLGLLTKERNIFISYKRADSQALANQLYGKFLHAGYTVFLDTESLSAGVNFQKTLRHRLADSFVLVLLNSKQFFDDKSKWTLEEYNTAQNLRIGICSILLPSVEVKRELSFNDIMRLDATDFADDNQKEIKEGKLDEIVLHIKSIYARLYESRKQSLVNAFTESLRKQHIRYIQLIDGSLSVESNKLKCKVIPLIGIPKSWDYYISDLKKQEDKDIPVYLLYNNQCILDEWLKHLAWLEDKSGISTININDNISWIQTNL